MTLDLELRQSLTHGADPPCVEVPVVVDVLNKGFSVNQLWTAMREGKLHLNQYLKQHIFVPNSRYQSKTVKIQFFSHIFIRIVT